MERLLRGPRQGSVLPTASLYFTGKINTFETPFLLPREAKILKKTYRGSQCFWNKCSQSSPSPCLKQPSHGLVRTAENVVHVTQLAAGLAGWEPGLVDE